MPLKAVVEIVFYLGLLVCSIAFCYQSVIDYLEGITSFAVTTEDITANDLPTLTFCYEYDLKYFEFGDIHEPKPNDEYGKDVTITTKITSHSRNGGESIELEENCAVVVATYGLEIFLKKLEVAEAERFCFSIFMKWDGKATIDFQHMHVAFEIKYPNKGVNNYGSIDSSTEDVEQCSPGNGHCRIDGLKSAKAVLTTKQNSYGMLWERWFDGQIDVTNLEFNKVHDIRITAATEYHHIESTCTQESYYQCLGRRLTNLDLSTVQSLPNGASQYFDNQCSTITLPLDIPPLCTERNVSLINAYTPIWKHLRQTQYQHCIKTCTMKKFETKLDLRGDILYRRDKFGETPYNGYRIMYHFDLPSSTTDIRSEQPFKTVMREYYTMSLMQLIGNVGGTLGMFIGFSFIGASNWLLPKCSKMFVSVSQRLRAKEETLEDH